MKYQAPGPGSPVIELPNLSPGGSPTKSPFRRQGQGAGGGLQLGPSPLGAGAGGGGNPSSLSNATAFLPGVMLPASPLSPQQQAQQLAVGGGSGAQRLAAGGGSGAQRPYPVQPAQLLSQQQQQQQHGRSLALQQQAQQTQHEQHLAGFGSTINLFQEGWNGHGKARQAAGGCPPQQQQQQQLQYAELFFRRSPGLTTLGMEQSLPTMRMSPLQGLPAFACVCACV
jgi:hypothetical protein